MKAKRIMDGCELTYLQNPNKFSSLMNYTLWCHAINLENDRARVGRKVYLMTIVLKADD